MANANKGSIEERLKLAKAHAEYRNISGGIERAVWLVRTFGISQMRAAEEEKVSRPAVQRGLKAAIENRTIGIVGRPPYLNPTETKRITSEVVRRSTSLDCVRLSELRSEVRCPF